MPTLRQAALTSLCPLLALFAPPAQALAAPPPSTALRSPGGGASGPLFAPAAPLAVENRYADPRMWGDLYQEFSVGAVGTGVAVGDFDKDGRPDLFVVSKTEQARLFRNEGNWIFKDVTLAAGITGDPAVWKQAAAFADIDNDGFLDLYLTRFNAPNLLFRNQGDGTFREEGQARGLALVDACGSAAFCDYDRDGDLDVLVQTNLLNVTANPDGQPNHLLRNDGTGRFTEVTVAAGLQGRAQGHSAMWWDYDGDGWPDLYLANDFEAPDFLYRNNRDGTFTNVAASALPHTPYSAMGADLGDVDNDGHEDLLVADMAARDRERDQRTMALSRARAKEETPAGAAPSVLRNTLYLATGTPYCREAAPLAGLAATDWTWSLRFEDYDCDGDVDLFVTNGMVRELHQGDLMARIMTAESGRERVRLMKDSPPLAEANLAFRNEGDLKFTEVGRDWGLGAVGVSFGAATGDFDGDGFLDLVYTNYQTGPTFLRNQGSTAHRALFRLEGVRSNRFGIGARVVIETGGKHQTRTLTLARGYLSTSEPVAHFGLGTQATIDRVTVYWSSGYTESWEDLAADRSYRLREGDGTPTGAAEKPKPLLTATEDGPRFLQREETVDETRAQPLLTRRLHRRGPALAVADFNRDGVDDLAVAGTTRDGARLFLSDQNGALGEAGLLPLSAVPMNDGPLVAVDANGDGAVDLLQTRGGANLPGGSPAYQPQLWLNDGRGKLSPSPAGFVPASSVNVGAVAVADFNRDGRPDVFLGARALVGRYPLPPSSVLWLGQGAGWSDASATIGAALRDVGLVTAAAAADVNGDEWPDLIVAAEWSPVRVFLNRQGAGFEEATDSLGFGSGGRGWWSSLTVADLNGDGRPDFAVGNAGLNTGYGASDDEPLTLLYGDFRGTPKPAAVPALIETVWDRGQLYPLRSKRQLASAVPSVNARYPTLEAYARAPLAEMLGGEVLARAARLTVTSLSTGAFLSSKDGTYQFDALPRIAQLAPTQAILATDLNGDGRPDLLLAQNSPAPLPVIGRFSGSLGLVLLNEGGGRFTALPPETSGLLAPGDCMDLAVLQGKEGVPALLVVSRSNRPNLVFRLP